MFNEDVKEQYNFIIIDDDSNQLLGCFSDVIGLCGDNKVNVGGKVFHKIFFKEGIIFNELERWCSENKKWMNGNSSNLKINVINLKDEIIASYYFIFSLPQKCIKVSQNVSIYFIGILPVVALPYILNIWKEWRVKMPTQLNMWSQLNFWEKRAWLQAVQLYNLNLLSCTQDKPEGSIFEINGKYVFDYPSFFCALGEAINGPCGYFGTTLDNLTDCLYGGFGATIPFTILWKNSEIARESLNCFAWKQELKAWKEQTLKSIDFDGTVPEVQNVNINNVNLFDAILDLFEEKHVHIKLL